MKKKLILKKELNLISTLIFFTLFIVWLNGCKKNTSGPGDGKSSLPATNKIPDDILRKFRNTLPKMIFPADTTRYQSLLFDRNGNEIRPGNGRVMSYPCNTIGLVPSFRIDQEQVTFSCSGFYLYAVLDFSTGFQFALNDPNSPFSPSTISFKIIDNSSGSTLYQQLSVSISASDIISQFPDAGDPDVTHYFISYKSPLITSPASPASVTFNYFPSFYTNCSILCSPPHYITKNHPSTDHTDPCNRIDVVDISTGGMGNPGFAYFDGSNATFCYPSGFVPPQEHEVQWKKVGDPTYGTYQSLNFAAFCTPLPPVANLLSYDFQGRSFPVTGNLTFRFRNVKKPTYDPCSTTITCTGPWSNEVIIPIY
jgi:hypothetical protein